ncbi:VOC family protein [Dactylosporangium sp. NPDC049140]|uniref:VOC family protein n=1 Tax=Dactylosporangium sp. NPDC049140 TaxID=3155647 RepID=UPI0033FD024E
MASKIGDIIMDCADPEVSAAFWCAALDYRVTERDHTGVAIAGDPTAPAILLIGNADPKRGKTPVHFDLWPTDRDQAAEVERLVTLGATRVDIGQRDVHWVVLADPAGHEFCVMPQVLPPEPQPCRASQPPLGSAD